MRQAEGFQVGGPNKVCRLRKSLYGLKQAARNWNAKLHATLLKMGFKRIDSDRSVYIYVRGAVRIIVPIFVDDITLASTSPAALDKAVAELATYFALRDLGDTKWLLGIEVTRNWDEHSISLSQRQYIVDMLKTYGMEDTNPNKTPMEPGIILTKPTEPITREEAAAMAGVNYLGAVGSLMYLATMTRPDISYAVGVLARFNSDPRPSHYKAVKHLFRYLKGTMDYKLVYKQQFNAPEPFIIYSDADHGGNKDNGKSTGGYVSCVGGGAVNWSSKLQPTVSLSTTEAEYIAAVEAGKEVMWMRNILQEFGYPVKKPSSLLIDNLSAISVAKNPEHHGRMKHLDLKHYWLRDAVEAGHMTPVHVPTQEMAADVLTKALPRDKLEHCRELMGLRPP